MVVVDMSCDEELSKETTLDTDTLVIDRVLAAMEALFRLAVGSEDGVIAIERSLCAAETDVNMDVTLSTGNKNVEEVSEARSLGRIVNNDIAEVT